jgi:hypothetical protein
MYDIDIIKDLYATSQIELVKAENRAKKAENELRDLRLAVQDIHITLDRVEQSTTKSRQVKDLIKSIRVSLSILDEDFNI